MASPNRDTMAVSSGKALASDDSVVDVTALLQAIATALGTAADEAGDPTVIGLLKEIAANTEPA